VSHTFYLTAGDGRLPARDVVRQACEAAGGELIEPQERPPDGSGAAPAGGSAAATAVTAGNGVAGGAGGAPAGGAGACAGSVGWDSAVEAALRRLRRGSFGFAFAPRGGRWAGGGGAAAPLRAQARRASAGGGAAGAGAGRAAAGGAWGADVGAAASFESGHMLSF
jgi:hypothetical protein